MQLFGITFHPSVDAVALTVAVLMVLLKIFLRSVRGVAPIATTHQSVVDALNGVSIVPFLLMMGSVTSDEAFKLLVKTNPGFIGVAGLIGIVFIVSELINS